MYQVGLFLELIKARNKNIEFKTIDEKLRFTFTKAFGFLTFSVRKKHFHPHRVKFLKNLKKTAF